MSTLIKARPNESKFYYHIMRSGFNYSFTGGTKVYIPLASAENARETSSLTGGSESLVFTVPYDGSVEKIIARSEEVCGSTEIAFHSSSLASEVPSPSPTQTVTVDMSVDDTNYNFDFADDLDEDVDVNDTGENDEGYGMDSSSAFKKYFIRKRRMG